MRHTHTHTLNAPKCSLHNTKQDVCINMSHIKAPKVTLHWEIILLLSLDPCCIVKSSVSLMGRNSFTYFVKLWFVFLLLWKLVAINMKLNWLQLLNSRIQGFITFSVFVHLYITACLYTYMHFCGGMSALLSLSVCVCVLCSDRSLKEVIRSG